MIRSSGVYYQRFKSTEEKFLEKVDKRSDDECWLWLAAMNYQGYGMFRSGGYITAHRYSWSLYQDAPIPKGMFICHHCDNPSCVNPKHLFLGTRKDNTRDMWNKNRHPAPVIGNQSDDVLGEKNPRSILKTKDVLVIRKLFTDGVSQIELSALYNIKKPAIWKIVHNKNWKHI